MTFINPEDFEQLYKESNLNWNYDFLSECSYITWNMVRNNLDKPWNFKKLSRNSIITFDMVDSTSFLIWDWDELSYNPNMTFEIVQENIRENWNLSILSERFTHEEIDKLYTMKESYIEHYSDSDSDYGYDSCS